MFIHHGWRKIENWHLQILQDNLILMILVDIFFTMVKENFENWHLDILQNNLILMIVVDTFLNHGWRKFWKLTLRNTSE